MEAWLEEIGAEVDRVMAALPTVQCVDCGSGHREKGWRCFDCTMRRERAAIAVSRTAATIPPRYQWIRDLNTTTLDERVDRKALAQARAVELGKIDRLTLLGPAGRGKTCAAVALALAWAKAHGHHAEFANSYDIGYARATHHLGSEAPLVARMMSAPLAVLDDLGGEAPNHAEALQHVIHVRHERCKPTIVTSGLMIEQIGKRYGGGTERRLFEGAAVIQVAGRR